MFTQKTLTTIQNLDAKIREASARYYHSRPLAAYTTEVEGKVLPVSLDLRALMLICAATGNNVLLSGATGSGKTHFAEMVQAGLAGKKGYKKLQMDASFSLDKLRDIAFQTVAGKGKLSEAVQETPLLTAPMVLVDEYNRAPTEITNMIQGWLQNGVLVFEGGREVQPGVSYKTDAGEAFYQWKIATANEGAKYGGARKFDKASRDRLAVEIPLDVFSLTDEDRRKLREKRSSGIEVYNGDGALEDLLRVMQEISEVPISGAADEFLLYLGRMNHCVKAPNKTKLEVENFSPEYCKGCHHSRGNKNLCGSVFAPSERSTIALQGVAKGFASYRCLQTQGNPQDLAVELEDVLAAAPFVLYSKLDIHPGWIDTQAKGSRWQAVNTVLKLTYGNFKTFIKNNLEHLRQETPQAREAVQKYGQEKDPWCVELSRG